MKHVKKKFIKSYKVGEGVKAVLDSHVPDMNAIAKLQEKKFEGHYALVLTDTDDMIQSFLYEKAGVHYVLLEPNPIVMYFETARHNAKNIPGVKKKLLEEAELPGKTMNNIYQYYQLASITATFLFTSIEAFVNNFIPEKYEYKRVNDRRTEVFDRFQVQREISFEEKIKKVLPDIIGKQYHIEHSHKYDTIVGLKGFRDSIAHTKSDNDSPPGFYKKLYTTALNFDFDKTLINVRDFINYYEPNLIEDCNCGQPD